MHTKTVVALILFCSTTFLYAADLRFQFIGNEAFLITDGKTTLLTDFPYSSGAFGYMTYDFQKIQPEGDVLCLITHGHADHFESGIFEKTNWRIIAPADVIRKIDRKRVVPSATQMKFNDIVIEPIETPHGKIGHHSYLVTWHGKRFYFTGDTESIDALLVMKKLDIAFVTPWLLSAVQKSGRKIDAASIIIYHHTGEEQPPSCDRCKVLNQYESFASK